MDGGKEISVSLGARIFGARSAWRQRITYSAGGPYDPARQPAAIGGPVFGIENTAHVKMRMAGQKVNVLVRLLPEIQEIGIDSAAAFHTFRPVTHAVAKGDAIGQRSVHSYHQGTNFRIGRSALHHSFQPSHLLRRELIERGIIQINKIHAALDPVKVRPGSRVIWIVCQALLFESGRIKPLREFGGELLTPFGRRGFMIADTHKDRHGTEGAKLILDEIIPGVVQISSLLNGFTTMLR